MPICIVGIVIQSQVSCISVEYAYNVPHGSHFLKTVGKQMHIINTHRQITGKCLLHRNEGTPEFRVKWSVATQVCSHRIYDTF